MHNVEAQLRAYADWVQRTWPDDDLAAHTDSRNRSEPAVTATAEGRGSNRPLLLTAALVAVLATGVGALLAFGPTDRDAVHTTALTSPIASTVPSPTTSSPPPDLAYTSWQPDHLSADGRALTINVEGHCGRGPEDVETTVHEREDSVEIEVTAAPLDVDEARYVGCPELYVAAPVEIALAEPLGEREIVDAIDPGRDLHWAVEPGSVSARVILRSDEGAVAADVPSDLYLVLGLDAPMVPLRVDQVRDGIAIPGQLTFRPDARHVGVYGSIDRLPLSADTFEQQGTFPIPPPDPAVIRQQLVVTLGPGAVTAEGRRLLLDPTRVTVSWVQEP